MFGRRNIITPAMVAVAAAVAFAVPATAAEVVLGAQTGLPRHHDLVKSFLAKFRDVVNARGTGVVRIMYRGGPEITPARKAGSALKRGVIDMLHSPAAYYSGTVPHALGMMATNLTPKQIRANGGFDMLAKVWREKLNAHIVAWAESGAQYNLYLNTEPKLRKDGVPDLTGLKLRSTSAYRPLMTALGATVIRMKATEVYTGLQRGVVQGFGWPNVALAAMGLGKVVKYRIDPPFYHLANLVMVNLDRWNSLPRKARDILTRAGLEYEETSNQGMKELARIDAAKLMAAGARPYPLGDAGGKKYLSIAYNAMWKRLTGLIGEKEAAAFRAKLYVE